MEGLNCWAKFLAPSGLRTATKERAVKTFSGVESDVKFKESLLILAKAGAPKPGTKTFFNWLDKHPEIEKQIDEMFKASSQV